MAVAKRVMTPEQRARHAERQRAWRAANVEKTREIARRSNEKNAERIRQRSREWREANRERDKAAKRAHYERTRDVGYTRTVRPKATSPAERAERNRWERIGRKYGLTQEQYLDMARKQKHACAICKEPFEATPHVDHDHATGAVRGLLCAWCNHGLGRFRDDTKSLRAAVRYLERSRRP